MVELCFLKTCVGRGVYLPKKGVNHRTLLFENVCVITHVYALSEQYCLFSVSESCNTLDDAIIDEAIQHSFYHIRHFQILFDLFSSGETYIGAFIRFTTDSMFFETCFPCGNIITHKFSVQFFISFLGIFGSIRAFGSFRGLRCISHRRQRACNLRD
jgi:hypothetical protein